MMKTMLQLANLEYAIRFQGICEVVYYMYAYM